MWNKIKQKVSKFWDGVKAFFDRSETIFLARINSFLGFFIAAFAAVDPTPLVALAGGEFSQKSFITTGIIVGAYGIIQELARKRNANLGK